MIRLKAEKLSQAYHRRFVFRNVNLDLSGGELIALLGSNGSGKSTLLKTLAGALLPFGGTVSLRVGEEHIAPQAHFKYVSLAAPYLELIEEYTLTEFLHFCGKLRPWRADVTPAGIMQYACLEEVRNRELKYFSSGMKQRVRLTMALLADTPVVMLDEPISNLDRQGIEWYQKLIREHGKDRLLIVASNENEEEYYFCNRQLRLEDYK